VTAYLNNNFPLKNNFHVKNRFNENIQLEQNNKTWDIVKLFSCTKPGVRVSSSLVQAGNHISLYFLWGGFA